MANDYFQFKQFTIHQDQCAMKVCTDSCVFGAWVAKQIEQSKVTPSRILDIGGGTGLLSLMLAQKTKTEIDAVEIEEKAFLQMSENFLNSPFADRLWPIRGNIKNFPSVKYSVIISNPPFFEGDLKSPDEKYILAMHDSGLLLNELIDEIENRLEDGGDFYIMIPFRRFEYMEHLFKEREVNIQKKILLKHSMKTEPFRVFYKGNFNGKKEMRVSLIPVYSGEKYSEEFVSLLKDYYLYL